MGIDIFSTPSSALATALSPETGAVGDTQAGGNFGPYLKRCGFDAVVITGKADKPCYIFIENDKAELRDAADYSGQTILDARDLFIKQLGTFVGFHYW